MAPKLTDWLQIWVNILKKDHEALASQSTYILYGLPVVMFR